MIGKTISHYKITEKIGEGGMGVVYKAMDMMLKRTVALKFLPAELSTDHQAKDRFIREAQAASVLDHPNICNIHEISETEDGQMFIVMSCYEGKTLKERIANAPLSLDEASDIAIQIVQGLARAHEKGITHRDIKPANIMLTSDGAVKILDFGLAKLSGYLKITEDVSTLGTVAYMSPEQAAGEITDHRTDIWSFGVVLYEMLTGELPFKGEYQQAVIYAILNTNPAEPLELNSELPAPLNEIIMKSLAKSATDRYQSFHELLADLKELKMALSSDKTSDNSVIKTVFDLARRPTIFIPVLVFLILTVCLIFWIFEKNDKIKWAKYIALPEIEEQIDSGNITAAFNLAVRVEKVIPDDSILISLWPQISRPLSINTDPQGASVFWREYYSSDDSWILLGTTPVDSMRLALGLKHLKIEKKGFQTVYLVPKIIPDTDLKRRPLYLNSLKLDTVGSLPDNMIRIYPKQIVSTWQKIEDWGLTSFLIDKFEVTNKEYKAFVDAGGYRNKKYWHHPFIKDGKIISWEKAISLFKDKTGRPGPATWEVGNYPENMEDYPVTGVCWYEAAAYADFIDKQLLTVTHWKWASGSQSGPDFMTTGNLSGDKLNPVGSFKNIGPFGTYDMAGNAKEWVWNAVASYGKRYILGGGWDDTEYAFTNDQPSLPAFDRSETNGFRCMKLLEHDTVSAKLRKPIDQYIRNVYQVKPVSDETFDIFLRMFSYEKTELNESTESEFTHRDWNIEKVSYDAAYGNERVSAYLFIPKNGKSPLQTVVYYPGSGVIGAPPDMITNTSYIRQFDFILKSGRAVMHPVYNATFERSLNPPKKMWESGPYMERDYIIMWAKDLCRSVDYLEIRPEIDTSKLAYFGYSWGANLSPIMLSAEKRFLTAILYVGGFFVILPPNPLPEIDRIHYVPRLELPVLMLNGKYDHVFPYKTAQIPFFNMLGTPAEHKKHFVDNTLHNVGRDALRREILAWLDTYLGSVE